MNPDLDKLRNEIELVDDALVDVLARRAQLVRAIWAQKARLDLPQRDADRETAELGRLLDRAEARGLAGDRVADVLARVIGHDLLAPPVAAEKD